jgi:hypothetical protein
MVIEEARFLYFHDLAVMNNITPNISRRPRSIVAVRTHFPDPPK